MRPVYKVVNLTPHEVRVVAENGMDVVYPPSGKVARLQTVNRVINIEGLPPVVNTEVTGIEGLPAPEPGVVYLTSSLVAQYAARLGRLDVLSPDTGPESAVRNEAGQIIGVRRLQRFWTSVIARKYEPEETR